MTNNQQPDGNYRQVFNTALRILTGRDHSKAELIRKLKRRGFAPNDIEKAVAECERLDYINDERSARVYIEQLIRKGYGRKRIDYEMKKKGFNGEHIQNIILESVSGADELEGARQILTKNIRRFERVADLKKEGTKFIGSSMPGDFPKRPSESLQTIRKAFFRKGLDL